MPKFYYPLRSFNPDVTTLGNEGIGMLNNMIPINGRYQPSQYFDYKRPLEFGPGPGFTAITGRVLGLLCRELEIFGAVGDGTTGVKLFASDLVGWGFSDVYHEYDVSPAAATWLSPSDVCFANYGSYIYVCNGNDNLHWINFDTWIGAPTATDFVRYTPTTGAATLAPYYICSHQGSLFAGWIRFKAAWNGFANQQVEKAMLWWSAFDDPNGFGSYAFTPQLKGSDYKFLYETPGEITGMISTGDLLFVFKSNSIYVVEGPPFRVQLLNNEVGTDWHKSLQFFNGWVYFYSRTLGPCRVNTQGQIEYLAYGKFSKVSQGYMTSGGTIVQAQDVNGFFDMAGQHLGIHQSVAGNGHIQSAVDTILKHVYWLIPTTDALSGTDTAHMHLLVFDTVSGEFGSINPLPKDQTGANSHPLTGYNLTNIVGVTYPYINNRSAMVAIGPPAYNTAYNGARNWYLHYPQRLFAVPDSGGDVAIYTKFFRPPTKSNVTTRITSIRPILKIGYNSANLRLGASIWTVNDYISDENTIFATPNETSYNRLPDDRIVFDSTVNGIEHCIKFTMDTVNGVTEIAYSKTALPSFIDGFEIEYEEASGVAF